MQFAVRSPSSTTADYINPVISATKTVFETMLDSSVSRTGLRLKADMSPQHELSAVIGITGKAAGTIVLSVSRVAAIGIYERMLGETATEITTEVCDAVGELTNMIAGSAKAQLERFELSISIPNIISGVDHNVHYPSNVTPFCIVFDFGIGPFTIEVGFAGIV